jgi:hypothetical protein
MPRSRHTVYLFLIALLLFSRPALSQSLKAFTPDSAQFLTELKEFFEPVSSNHRQEVKKLLTRLEFEWEYGNFKDPYRSKVYATANRMLQEKLKPYPDFYYYFQDVLHFYDSRQPLADYDSLHASFIPLLNMTSKKPFVDYLASIHNLFINRTLYDFRSVSWNCREGNFIFVYDTIPRLPVSLPGTALRSKIHRGSFSPFKTAGKVWEGS